MALTATVPAVVITNVVRWPRNHSGTSYTHRWLSSRAARGTVVGLAIARGPACSCLPGPALPPWRLALARGATPSAGSPCAILRRRGAHRQGAGRAELATVRGTPRRSGGTE